MQIIYIIAFPEMHQMSLSGAKEDNSSNRKGVGDVA